MDCQLQAAYAYVLKPGEDTVDLDSALRLVDQVQNDNTHIHDPRVQGLCYLIYSHAWSERKRRDLAKSYALRAVDVFGKMHDPLDLAYAYVTAARYYTYDVEQEDKEKIRLYGLAVPLFDSAGRKEMQASTLELLGDCISHIGDNDQSRSTLLQALKLYLAIGHTDLRNLYTLLGDAYADNGDAKNAFSYLLMAVKQEEELSPQGLGPCTAYNRLGLAYFKFADFPNAENAFEKALEIAIRHKDTTDIRVIGVNVVNARASQNKSAAALHTLKILTARYPYVTFEGYLLYASGYITTYSSLGLLDSARKYVDRFIQIHDSLSADDANNTYLYQPIIRYMLAAHRYDMVKRYCPEFRDFCTQRHMWTRLYSSYYYLFKADSATGDFKSAVTDYQQYVRLKDSLLSDANRKQIAALEHDYETEKKDKDIAVLTRKETLNQYALHQAGLVRNAVIGGSMMLLILLGVSYNRYRIKRRSNFLLQLQKQAIDQKNLELQQLTLSQGKLLNEKEWLLKEIHHRVKNNLQIAMSLLNTQTYYLDNEKAVEAIRQSRNRMFAMSLIHQRLYQSDNLELIHMNRYIPELINYIEDSFARDRNICFRSCIDPVRLDVAQAVPIGLIINEAVTNSIKYAFPHRDGGTIDILLKYLKEKDILLEIADDGVGVKAGFDIKQTNSMGMQLIDTLNQQLDGTMTVQNRNGLVITILLEKFA